MCSVVSFCYVYALCVAVIRSRFLLLFLLCCKAPAVFYGFFGRGFLFGHRLVSLRLSWQPVNDVEDDRLRNNDAEGSESAHGHHVRFATQND